MNQIEAIHMRQSRRAYQPTPISPDQCAILNQVLNRINQESGLSLQFITDGKDAFKQLKVGYGIFSGVQSFFAMIGKANDKNLKEKIGYYGELLVLEATKLGLGSCWIGATITPDQCPFSVGEDEKISLIITVGNVSDKKTLKENIIAKLTHRRTKSIDQMSTVDSPTPEWFLEGMKAVQKAPSAINLQPVHFEYKNGTVTATVKSIERHQLIDLGIAKAHFEIGAGGKFDFGNGASFLKA